MINKIFNEDCLEGMKKIPDGSVDTIICDPPFGITDCDFDKPLPPPLMWEQFLRVTKLNAAIVLFSQMPFGSDLIQSNRKMFRYEWIYRKNLGVGFLNAKKMPLKVHENILVFYRKLPTYNPQFTQGKPYVKNYPSRSLNYKATANGTLDPNFYHVNDGRRYPVDVLKYKIPYAGGDGDKSHPQQKPVDLLEYLIRTYTNEGEVVLDATIGSGSTCVAAVNTGRKFIGFETDKKFFEIAQKRIDEAFAKKEQELFLLGESK